MRDAVAVRGLIGLTGQYASADQDLSGTENLVLNRHTPRANPNHNEQTRKVGLRMPNTDSTTHTLDLPGARLYYERRGSGPVLLLIGAPMDSAGFAGIAPLLADTYTVVTYDPRGISRSTLDDASQEATPDLLADDVHRLLAAFGTEPAYVFGSSGGATTGLALVTAHPGQVHTLIAHEPPLIELLPDSAQLRAAIDDLYDTYRSDGPHAAMEKFFAVTGLEPGPAAADGEPDEVFAPEPFTPTAEMRANTDYFLAHMIRPFTRYRPDVAALRAASNQLVVAGGATSTGQLPYRTAVALADELDKTVVDFPGDHAGFARQPERFAGVLRHVLATTASATV